MILLYILIALINVDFTTPEDRYISSYSVDGRTLVVIKKKPIDPLTIHYIDVFNGEVMPSEGKIGYGCYFPNGGIIKFDKSFPESQLFNIVIPAACNKVYVSTLLYEDFLLSKSDKSANASIKNRQNICYLHLGLPSVVHIQTDTKKGADFLDVVSMDQVPSNISFSGKSDEIIEVNSSIFFHWKSSSTQSDFVRIQNSHLINSILYSIDDHSTNFLIKDSVGGSLLLEEEDDDDMNFDYLDYVYKALKKIPKQSGNSNDKKNADYDSTGIDEDDNDFFAEYFHKTVSTYLMIILSIVIIIMVIKFCKKDKMTQNDEKQVLLNENLDDYIPHIIEQQPHQIFLQMPQQSLLI